MQDTIHFANLMNLYYELDLKPQHDFYYNGIPKGKRFGKWEKKEEFSADIQIISDYFNINNRTAEQYLKMLTSDQLNIIRDKMCKGGKGNGK